MSAASSTRVDALLGALYPPGDATMRVKRAFQIVGIAEEEIERAMGEAPRKRAKLRQAFKHLYTEVLLRHGDAIYRAHCREILGRVKRGDVLDPGTDAECLAVLSEQSLRAPLASEFAHAMSILFARVFPEKAVEIGQAGSEAWPGRTEEIIAELRRKTARDRSGG